MVRAEPSIGDPHPSRGCFDSIILYSGGRDMKIKIRLKVYRGCQHISVEYLSKSPTSLVLEHLIDLNVPLGLDYGHVAIDVYH